MSHTIIAGNVPGDCSGGVVSLGFNLDSDNTCNLSPSTDLPGTDPLLGPLQDNGGPTETHALLPGSPAIDLSLAIGEPCGGGTDQRGVPRPQGLGCDIGAFEVGPLPPCTLDLTLDHDGSDLTMGFDLGTQEAALWDVGVWSVFGSNDLWSLPVPVVDPPVFLPVSFPFPNIGWVAIATKLTTGAGVVCVTAEVVDTGGPGPSRKEVEDLVEQSGVLQTTTVR